MQTKVGSSVFRSGRTNFWRETFTCGRYVLVACTFEPLLEGQFLLRCYAGHAVRMKYDTASCSLHWLTASVLQRHFSQRRSVVKSVGCFQRRLFVCLFVNTITSR